MARFEGILVGAGYFQTVTEMVCKTDLQAAKDILVAYPRPHVHYLDQLLPPATKVDFEALASVCSKVRISALFPARIDII